MIKHTLKYIEESIPKEVEEKILEEVSRRCNVDPLFEDEKWSDRVRIVYEEIFGKDEDAHDVWFEMGEMNREADKTESEGQMTIEEQITIFEHNAEHERKEGDLNNCLHFRQLAEWLKELKAHREAWMKVVSEVDQHTEIHSDGEFYIKNFDVKKIIAEYRPKEGDA